MIKTMFSSVETNKDQCLNCGGLIVGKGHPARYLDGSVCDKCMDMIETNPKPTYISAIRRV